jgi:hypothetical protein
VGSRPGPGPGPGPTPTARSSSSHRLDAGSCCERGLVRAEEGVGRAPGLGNRRRAELGVLARVEPSPLLARALMARAELRGVQGAVNVGGGGARNGPGGGARRIPGMIVAAAGPGMMMRMMSVASRRFGRSAASRGSRRPRGARGGQGAGGVGLGRARGPGVRSRVRLRAAGPAGDRAEVRRGVRSRVLLLHAREVHRSRDVHLRGRARLGLRRGGGGGGGEGGGGAVRGRGGRARAGREEGARRNGVQGDRASRRARARTLSLAW